MFPCDFLKFYFLNKVAHGAFDDFLAGLTDFKIKERKSVWKISGWRTNQLNVFLSEVLLNGVTIISVIS
jgi:hypothetical protein